MPAKRTQDSELRRATKHLTEARSKRQLADVYQEDGALFTAARLLREAAIELDCDAKIKQAALERLA